MVDIFDQDPNEVEIEINQNMVEKGDDVNLTAKDPTLKRVVVGMGWDQNAFDSDPLDLDVSAFMLNRMGKTRVNEDFVFYNNEEGSDMAVTHGGDSRTGAGDGDDECIIVDLNKVHFDIMRIMFVLSIYKGDEKGHSLHKVRKPYIRLLNMDSNIELLRYNLTSDIQERKETAMLVGSLNREGPKWHFKVIGDCVAGGLQKIATDYDIIVQSA